MQGEHFRDVYRFYFRYEKYYIEGDVLFLLIYASNDLFIHIY